MKTYRELMEVMSISDMNKITGGTAAQRKIAQDRQKKREAKNRGFGANETSQDDKKTAPPEPKETNNSSAIVKADPSAVTKAGSSAIRKPDLRKSQLGKWSQGVKNTPGKLAKKKETGLRKDPQVKEVDVKVSPADETKVAKKPGTTRPIEKDNSVIKNLPRKTKVEPTKKPKTNRLKGAKDALDDAGRKLKKFMDVPSPGVGEYGETEHRGLSGRNKGVGN